MSSNIQFEMVTGTIGQITLNKPEKRNALSNQMWSDLSNTLQVIGTKPSMRVLIITGAGEHFASGADISEFEALYATQTTSAETSLRISQTMSTLANFPKPTIAKIRGACVGGGCGLALACDIRIADNTAKFGITPGKLGLVYPFSDIERLINAVGMSYAKDILFSARIIKAKEAKQIGLVNHRVKQDELDDFVKSFADRICNTSPESNTIMKQLFLAHEKGQRGETSETQEIFLQRFQSNDFKEGYKAFLEKRKPEF